jgi:hypothetical protein
MQRADPHDDIDLWYRTKINIDQPKDLELLDRWCRLHVSDGRFDYKFHRRYWIFFHFEQQEDALMFRLAWIEKIG